MINAELVKMGKWVKNISCGYDKMMVYDMPMPTVLGHTKYSTILYPNISAVYATMSKLLS